MENKKLRISAPEGKQPIMKQHQVYCKKYNIVDG
jgi:hypothetical protein